MKYIYPLIAVLFLAGAYTATANPSQFIGDAYSSATTSPAYIGVGNTATHDFDTLVSGNTAAMDSAALLIQHTASSTLSVLDATVYYSEDGIDWFAESMALQNPGVFVGTTSTARVDHASTTVAHRFTGNTIASTTRFTLDLGNVPTRYVRVVYSVPTGAASSSVWSKFIGKKERSN